MLMVFCKYGCGKQAIKQDRCADSPNSCPANRAKNSLATKRKWETKGSIYETLPEETKRKMAWSSGLTKTTDKRVAVRAIQMVGQRRLSAGEKLNKKIYWEACQFNLGQDISSVLGFCLLKKFGMYHKTGNRGGVVRDHRVSIGYGYRNKICPALLSHPANCRFVMATENAKKSVASEITVEQLQKEIAMWFSKR